MLLRAFYPPLSKLAVQGMSIAGHYSLTVKKIPAKRFSSVEDLTEVGSLTRCA
jgi:hypothetical protein